MTHKIITTTNGNTRLYYTFDFRDYQFYFFVNFNITLYSHIKRLLEEKIQKAILTTVEANIKNISVTNVKVTVIKVTNIKYRIKDFNYGKPFFH